MWNLIKTWWWVIERSINGPSLGVVIFVLGVIILSGCSAPEPNPLFKVGDIACHRVRDIKLVVLDTKPDKFLSRVNGTGYTRWWHNVEFERCDEVE